jgi:hypothetical protein
MVGRRLVRRTNGVGEVYGRDSWRAGGWYMTALGEMEDHDFDDVTSFMDIMHSISLHVEVPALGNQEQEL